MIHIKTPATTANMGPGFDCIGMALQLYNNVWIEEIETEDLIIESTNENVPKNDENMIYQSLKAFYNEVGISKIPKVKIIQEDFIPMTRGLGSSAACVVAGLLAGNILSGVNLSRDELAFMAAKIEGHPDNTAPALLGGVIVGVLTDSKLDYIKIENEHLQNINFAVMIPEFPLATEKARKVLPKAFTIQDCIFNASRTALLTAAFMSGDFKKLSTAMDDRFHQPYRSNIIPNMDDIFSNAMNFGAEGIFLSGAGPTIIAVTYENNFCNNMQPYLDSLSDKWDISFIKPDFNGAVVL